MEVEDMKAYVSTFERIWDKYGCTLMCNEWTDMYKCSVQHIWHYTKKYDKLLNHRDCFLEVGRCFWQGEECGVPILVDGQHGGGDRREKNSLSGN
ncbi:hypothetical protein Taro_020984 [Colocasia esculenta]|uniref:Uncharacterized protein n=1 Tax=Colocasia esculenta TaxID=4460 RepID=A0A843UXR7_COLES|nr:hypothetical protein [Colocasia esculenta]